MSPVGGPRHYHGAGLGQVGLWGCPRCGADNTGPLEGGCTSCGAGVPRASRPEMPPTPPPPVPRVSERAPDDPTYRAAPSPLDQPPSESWQVAVGALWRQWTEQYPDATHEQTFTAGYFAGVRAARQQAAPVQPNPPPPAQETANMARTYRTVVAALGFFSDQILSVRPEEVETGEWLSADEVTNVIAQLQELLGKLQLEGVSHAV